MRDLVIDAYNREMFYYASSIHYSGDKPAIYSHDRNGYHAATYRDDLPFPKIRFGRPAAVERRTTGTREESGISTLSDSGEGSKTDE